MSVARKQPQIQSGSSSTTAVPSPTGERCPWCGTRLDAFDPTLSAALDWVALLDSHLQQLKRCLDAEVLP